MYVRIYLYIRLNFWSLSSAILSLPLSLSLFISPLSPCRSHSLSLYIYIYIYLNIHISLKKTQVSYFILFHKQLFHELSPIISVTKLDKNAYISLSLSVSVSLSIFLSLSLFFCLSQMTFRLDFSDFYSHVLA